MICSNKRQIVFCNENCDVIFPNLALQSIYELLLTAMFFIDGCLLLSFYSILDIKLSVLPCNRSLHAYINHF